MRWIDSDKKIIQKQEEVFRNKAKDFFDKYEVTGNTESLKTHDKYETLADALKDSLETGEVLTNARHKLTDVRNIVKGKHDLGEMTSLAYDQIYKALTEIICRI